MSLARIEPPEPSVGETTPSDPIVTPMDHPAVGVLAASHLLVDLCQGTVAAMLPFLVAAGDLTYAAAGGLVFAVSAASSVVQPVFGLWADRLAVGWLLPASVLVTGTALAAGAQAGSYWPMAALLGVSGLGVAAFHPEAARRARQASGSRAATGMSVFAVGGGLGFALAPAATAAALSAAGTAGLLATAPASILAAVLLVWRFPIATTARGGGHGPTTPGPAAWGAFAVLALATVTRSVVFVGLNTFLALYWMERFGASPAGGAAALSAFLGAGLCGTLLGGWLGDRVGHRQIVRVGFALAAILLPVVLLAPSAEWAMAALVPLAVVFSVPGSVLVVLGQEYLPGRVGLASGVTFGLAVSVGGMAAPIMGWVADGHGLGAVLVVLEGVLAAAVGLGFALSSPPACHEGDE